MLKDGTQVGEQSMTCNTPLKSLLRLEGRAERPHPINWLVTSSPSIYMIAPTLLPLWQALTLFIIWVLEGGGSSFGGLGNVEHLFITIAPWSTLTRSGSTY